MRARGLSALPTMLTAKVVFPLGVLCCCGSFWTFSRQRRASGALTAFAGVAGLLVFGVVGLVALSGRLETRY
jgi:hypothetical protein